MSQKYEYRPEVRWSDQDLLGHVNNARIVTLIEEGRTRYLKGIRAAPEEKVSSKLAVRLEVDYRKPVMYGSELLMQIWVNSIGRTSFELAFKGIQSGDIVFEAISVMVGVDIRTLSPRPLSEKEREYLQAYRTRPGS